MLFGEKYEDQYNLIIASSGEDRALYNIILIGSYLDGGFR